MSSWLRRIDTWLNASAPAERLAAMRILMGSFVVGYLVLHIREVPRLNGLDPIKFDPVGVAHLLSGPIAPSLLWVLYLGAIVVGVACIIGWRYSILAPVWALLLLFWASYHSSFGQLLHFEHLFTLHAMILAVAPAAAAWAVDAGGPKPPASVRFGWPIRLLAITTVVTYVLSGLAKLYLSGWGWLDGSVLGRHISYSAVRTELVGGPTPPLAGWVLDHGWMLAPMAIGALLIELGAPVALGGGRLRNLWVISALAFHTATALIMWVYFGYRGMGFAMAPFFRVERALAPIVAQLSKGGS